MSAIDRVRSKVECTYKPIYSAAAMGSHAMHPLFRACTGDLLPRTDILTRRGAERRYEALQEDRRDLLRWLTSLMRIQQQSKPKRQKSQRGLLSIGGKQSRRLSIGGAFTTLSALKNT